MTNALAPLAIRNKKREGQTLCKICEGFLMPQSGLAFVRNRKGDRIYLVHESCLDSI